MLLEKDVWVCLETIAIYRFVILFPLSRIALRFCVEGNTIVLSENVTLLDETLPSSSVSLHHTGASTLNVCLDCQFDSFTLLNSDLLESGCLLQWTVIVNVWTSNTCLLKPRVTKWRPSWSKRGLHQCWDDESKNVKE